jgi:hypothetical protein
MADFSGDTGVKTTEDVERYRFIQTDGTKATSSTDDFYGVSQTDEPTDTRVALCVQGRTRVVADGALSAGDEVMPSTDGKAQTASGTGNTVAGRVLEDASDGEEAVILVYGVHVTN